MVGGGRSVWDMFCDRPTTVYDRANGNIACDHYRLWQQDVSLMAELGIKAYRFSISWPRVLPAGTGDVDPAGLEFYDRLVDKLLAAGIDPYITLFHWDYPYDLYCRGGWLNRDSIEWFADYTKIIVDLLSDRVTHWMTLNEPQCFIGLGHQVGIHAPGDKMAVAEVLRAGHHALLAHGRAVQTIRANAKLTPIIGYAPVGSAYIPASESSADIDAARAKTFDEDLADIWSNSWWMDPVYLGRYPTGAFAAYGANAPKIRDGDMELIAQPLDFFGSNIYQAQTIKSGDNGKPEKVPQKVGLARTSMSWPVTPSCLYWAPKFCYERYKKPIYVTENGLSNNDWIAIDGAVHDAQRIDYLERHLIELRRAVADGVDVGGYFHWSFLDNFEWAEGYKDRFGLVYVDYTTQARTPKDSAYRYREIIQSNGTKLPG